MPTEQNETIRTTRSCNRHDDCAVADDRWREGHPGQTYPPPNFHCHDDCCEDCFGN
jgi:hypothetical protein